MHSYTKFTRDIIKDKLPIEASENVNLKKDYYNVQLQLSSFISFFSL